VAFLSLLALLLTVTQVSAHNVTPNDASPAPGETLVGSPVVVTLRFDEELISESSSIQVVDASGAVVDDGDGGIDLTDPDHATLVAHLSQPLPDGVYTVRYQATVLDGDSTTAEFQFAVGQSDVALSHEIRLSNLSVAEPEETQASNLPLYGGAAAAVILLAIGLAVVLRRTRSSSTSSSA
jgi:methionine-rich copper-binding protein CopC